MTCLVRPDVVTPTDRRRHSVGPLEPLKAPTGSWLHCRVPYVSESRRQRCLVATTSSPAYANVSFSCSHVASFRSLPRELTEGQVAVLTRLSFVPRREVHDSSKELSETIPEAGRYLRIASRPASRYTTTLRAFCCASATFMSPTGPSRRVRVHHSPSIPQGPTILSHCQLVCGRIYVWPSLRQTVTTVPVVPSDCQIRLPHGLITKHT